MPPGLGSVSRGASGAFLVGGNTSSLASFLLGGTRLKALVVFSNVIFCSENVRPLYGSIHKVRRYNSPLFLNEYTSMRWLFYPCKRCKAKFSMSPRNLAPWFYYSCAAFDWFWVWLHFPILGINIYFVPTASWFLCVVVWELNFFKPLPAAAAIPEFIGGRFYSGNTRFMKLFYFKRDEFISLTCTICRKVRPIISKDWCLSCAI